MQAMEIAQKNAAADESRKFIARVYGWMALALIISGVTAWIGATVPSVTQLIFGTRYSFYVLIAAEIALVFVISLAIRKLSVAAASILFIIYSVVNGLTLSSIFLVFNITSISTTFFISAAMFGAMTLYGRFTKSNLTSAVRYLVMALFGLIIASVVNLFLKSTVADWIISIVSVVVFIGLTAYDTQKIMRASSYADDSDVFKKVAIVGALELYLDFINIFLSLLKLFGRNKD